MNVSVKGIWYWLTRRVSKPWAVTWALALAGALLTGWGWWTSGPDVISAAPGMNGLIRDTTWSSVTLYHSSALYPTLLLGLGTGMVSALAIHSLTDVVSLFYRGRSEQNFERFFGPGALSRQERGRIVVQSDRVETLLDALLSDTPDVLRSVIKTLNAPHHNRLFKARHWLNARDAASAKVLRDELRRQHFPTPDLHIIERVPSADPFAPHARAPYVISMGLGFTDTTHIVAQAIDHVGAKFRIEKDTPKGDAIVIAPGLRGRRFDTHLDLSPVATGAGSAELSYVFPKGWTVEKWLAAYKDLPDYALIARYTATVDGRAQTRIVLAGFTEDGTLAAGRYLANRWEMLLEAATEQLKRESRGNLADFIAVIAGDARSTTTWTADPYVFEIVPII